MSLEFHCKGFDKMPRKTQEALAEMAGCLVRQVDRVPNGFHLLFVNTVVQRGDFWLRPTDHVWIESGAAHWGTTVSHPFQYARKTPPHRELRC